MPGDDKKIKVWDLAACNCIHKYRGHHSKVTALDWSAIGKASLTNRIATDPNDTNVNNSILCSAGMDGITNTKSRYHKFNLQHIMLHPDCMVAIGAKRLQENYKLFNK